MGINLYALDYLLNEAKDRPLRGRILSLGRQDINFNRLALEEKAREVGIKLAMVLMPEYSTKREFARKGYLRDEYLFRRLGFSECHALDLSDFEQAEIIYDLNSGELPESLLGKYDFILDGGTIEHVFHTQHLLENLHRMLADEGRIFHIAPSSNHIDHGFYMFSPTFFWDYYSANGYGINSLKLVRHTPDPTEPYCFTDYQPGCLDHLSFGGLDDRNYTILCMVTKSGRATSDRIPQQGSYLKSWERCRELSWSEPAATSFSKFDYPAIIVLFTDAGMTDDRLAAISPSAATLSALQCRMATLRPVNILATGVSAGFVGLLSAAWSTPDGRVTALLPPSGADLELTEKAISKAGLGSRLSCLVDEFSPSLPRLPFQSVDGVEEPPNVQRLAKDCGPFDLIYLDGQEATATALAELETASGFLASGGVIALHGVFDRSRGPQMHRAVMMFLEKRSDFIFYTERNWEPLANIGFLQHYPPGTKQYRLNSVYDDDFYDRCLNMHANVVPHIARSIHGLFRPQSVFDFGCGAGLWLREFRNLGVNVTAGIDGSRTAIEKRNRDLADMVTVHDLRNLYATDRRYDLCLCIDVIEHVEPEFEENVIRTLVNASDTIIFSSPPPGQGGDGHVNERPIAHWVGLFAQYGYIFYDNIRPLFEGNEAIPETTYQLNLYTVTRMLGKEDRRILAERLPMIEEILRDKERRIEDLFLQNLFLRRELDVAGRRPEGVAATYGHDQDAGEFFNMVKLVLPPERIAPENGFCSTFRFRTCAGRAFTRMPAYSRNVLCENGRPLATGSVIHDDIRSKGNGRYSLWQDQIYFSSSDNSDPRTNGREYSLQVPTYLFFLEQMQEKTIREYGL